MIVAKSSRMDESSHKIAVPEIMVITGGEGALAKAIAAGFHGPEWRISAPSHGELNVADPAAVEAYFHMSEVDLLICAAGMIRDTPLIRMSEADWDDVFDVNYHGGARCARAVMPGMLARGAGHIILISSYSALHPPAGQAAYAAAKAALLGLTKELAYAHGAAGIRINAILPGFIETPMTAGLSKNRLDEIRAAHVLGKFNTVDDVATFIRHLHLHLPNTSGQVFQLDSRPA
jgi:3-oxoacyl-[acyl-carrier protein] reductase